MKKGKVVFEGHTKDNAKYIIRYPKEDDSLSMCKYINELSKEQTYITFQGEEILPEAEKKYLEHFLKKILENKAVMLLVVIDNKIVGISTIEMREKIESHVGTLGISITKNLRNKGIGNTLIKLVLEEAKKNLLQLRIIVLGVFNNNPIAIKMYEKYNFKKYGSLPEGILYKDKYIDHDYMFLKIR